MISIEQAVFTSARTDRTEGYQVVAASPGVCAADVRELSVWGPSHDSMIVTAVGSTSVNFHPLPSGAYCVGRTTAAGSEYSGRRGQRIYTQCLIVSPKTLEQFANNPFALLKAVSAGGSLRTYDKVPKHLDSLRLVGRAAVVDESLLGQLRRDPGPRWMAAVVQAAIDSPTVAVAGGVSAQRIIAGLINCMPPECRTEFSFSTGLKVSSRRPFRIVALPAETDELRRVTGLHDLSVLNLSKEIPADFTPTHSWARLVERVLESCQVSFLSRHLTRRRKGCTARDLSELGLQMLEELNTTSADQEASEPQSKPDETAALAAEKRCITNAPHNVRNVGEEEPEITAADLGSDATDEPADSDGKSEYRRGHKPHQRFQADTPVAATRSQLVPPSKALSVDSPEVMQKLERLDDLVYEAMAGSSAVLDELSEFWPRLRAELGEEMLLESREQYLRHALAIWEKGTGLADPENNRRPEHAVYALDVLCVLFDEV